MQVIQLTKDLLAEAAADERAEGPAGAVPLAEHGGAEPAIERSQAQPVAAITAAPDLRIPSVLPPQVAQQIRLAQQRAALLGQAPASWAIGAKCQAVYSGDGQWCAAAAAGVGAKLLACQDSRHPEAVHGVRRYNARVEAVSVSGNFIVVYDGYDAREECDRSSVRARAEEEEEAYKGAHARA